MGTYDWTGTGGDNLWSNLNNWSPNNGPPGSADTADIGTDNFSVAVTGTSGVGDLDLGFFFLQQPVGSTVSVDNGGILDIDGPSNIFRASTLQSEPGGTIYLLFTGTLTNGGTVLVGQDLNGGGGSSTLNINGAVTLSGSGTVELGEITANFLATPSTGNIANYPNTSDTLINQSDTISGAGSIVLGTFDNQAGGTVEAGLPNGGALQIAASTFSNEGKLVVGTNATLNLGQDNANASLTNSGNITIDNNSILAIAGGYTISGGGGIQLAPGLQANTAPTAEITSDGNPAELILVNQTLKGAGTIGDANLTLGNASGTIAADEVHQSLTLNTGSNVITNSGTLAAMNDGSLLIESPVSNSGTIQANGGAVAIEAAVSVPIFPPGQHSTIDIGANGIIELAASVAGNITFTSGGAGLVVDANLANGGIGGDIVGAEASDVIVFGGLSSPVQQVSWQQNGSTGTLSLVESGGATVAVTLAGQYTNSDFTFQSDGVVEVQNPSPPSATSADMIMQDGGNGDLEIYDLGSNAIQASAALGQPFGVGAAEPAAAGATAGPSWQAAGLGDFKGTDTSDMMLRNSNTGAFEIWDVANNNITGSAAMGQVGLEWTVAGFGDFSGNPGETDMLIRNSNTGGFEIYDIGNNQITSAAPMGQVGLEWSVAGFGDFSTRTNESGMLMRNSNTGQFEVYDITNNTITSAAPMGQVGLEWQVAGFGDFSGNPNETDMLMRDTNNGNFEIYDISNDTITSAAPMGQVGMEWQVAGFGPINGAGTSDMLMRNTNTGAFEIYDIANNTITNATGMGQVGLEWSVAGIAVDPPGGAAPANAQLAQAMAAYAQGNSVPDAGSPPDQMTMPVATASPLATHS